MNFSLTRAISLKAMALTGLLLIALRGLGADTIPELRPATGPVSRDGHVKLIWQYNGGHPGNVYELQQAKNATFNDAHTIYRGPDLASFVSGLESDTYYYRVRLNGHSWSETVRIEVLHHSMRLTLILMVVGAVVFLLTAWIIIKGANQAVRERQI
ncbi:fibronectin type III domain-containing protein [Chitinophaga japonensis]|uniref:Fibronectin type-III domain-containing protein n=1 Tax=Chitinophaga japonensis TaxID=104662 RepID=A0A562STE2_CHIJA|nr:fibronectin type III domain-containing protein [Chitinophaga japonensis]TWI84040.1 hypothetical protein LX66_4402 [Chitinophaga japonensis]